MNSKIVLAFLAGAVLASGIVYMAVTEPAQPAKRVQAAAKPIYVTPAATVPAQPAAADPAPARSPVASAYVAPVERDPPANPRPDRPVKKAKPERQATVVGIRQVEVAQARLPQPVPPRSAPAQVSPQVAQASVAPSVDPPAAPELPQEPAKEPPPAEPAPLPAAPAAPQPHTVTLTAGMVLPVRIGETLTATRNQAGDSFLATLEQPLVVDGFVIAERGARLEGRIVEADPGGRVKGSSRLGVELVKLATADGQHVRIRTSAFEKNSESSAGMDAAKIGIGAAIGAAIGGIAGGGKGAGIGAGVGGAAGAGDVLLTRGKAASIAVETRVSFRLQEPVTITERLQ